MLNYYRNTCTWHNPRLCFNKKLAVNKTRGFRTSCTALYDKLFNQAIYTPGTSLWGRNSVKTN